MGGSLKIFSGPLAPMLRQLLRGVKIKLDADNKVVVIEQKGKPPAKIPFDEFEKAFNGQ